MKCLTRFLALSLVAVLALSLGLGVAPAAAADEGFKTIFDGKSLEGWDGDPKFWRVEDGADRRRDHQGQSDQGQHLPRLARRQTGRLRTEDRVQHAHRSRNSGIQIRSWEGEKWRVSGYQADMDGDNNYTGIIYGENFRGILAQRGTKIVIGTDDKPKAEKFADGKELAKFVKKQDWNEYHIIAKGNHITQSINGQLMCELTDEDTVARKDGIIALQLHAGPPMKVQFRNIRIKEMPKADAPPAPTSAIMPVEATLPVAADAKADGKKDRLHRRPAEPRLRQPRALRRLHAAGQVPQ